MYNSFFLFRTKKINYTKKIKKVYINKYKKNNSIYTNITYLNNVKNGLLSKFIKTKKKDEQNNSFLKIEKYEKKIKKITYRKLNMGFFDFLIYTFFKINMLSKPAELKKK